MEQNVNVPFSVLSRLGDMLFEEAKQLLKDDLPDAEMELPHAGSHAFWKNTGSFNFFRAVTHSERIDKKNKAILLQEAPLGKRKLARDYLYKRLLQRRAVSLQTKKLTPYLAFLGYKDLRHFIDEKGEEAEKEWLKRFSSYSQKPDPKRINLPFGVIKQLNKLRNTTWALYYRDPSSTTKTRNTDHHLLIGVGIFRVKDPTELNGLEIEYVEGDARAGKPSKFIGSVDERSTTYSLICNFVHEDAYGETQPQNRKALNLRFYLPTEVENENLHVGLYTDMDQDLKLHGGTIAICRLDDEELAGLSPKIVSCTSLSDEHIYDEVPEAVIEYFEDKDLNYIRVPKTVHSFNRLAHFNTYHRTKQSGILRRSYRYKYDLLVITPIRSFLEGEDYDKGASTFVSYRDRVEDMLKANLKTFEALRFMPEQVTPGRIKTISHLLQGLYEIDDAHKSLVEPERYFQDILGLMRLSRALLFITPHKILSTLYIHFGWVLWLKQPTFFIRTHKEGEQPEPVHYAVKGASIFDFVHVPNRTMTIGDIPLYMKNHSNDYKALHSLQV